MNPLCPNCGTPLATETIDEHKVVFCVECGVEQEVDDADV